MKSDTDKYADMLYMPHHVSKKHPRMDICNRAAQFAPFAALTGYEDAIAKTGRLTFDKAECMEDYSEIIDKIIRDYLVRNSMKDMADEKECLTVTYFVKDKEKQGGVYMTKRGQIKKIDEIAVQIVFSDGTKIALSDIVDVSNI